MSPTRMSKLEAATRLVLEFTDAFNHQDVAAMMHLISNDCVFENTAPPPDGAVYSGKAQITQYYHDFFHQSPHAHLEIEEIFGLGFRCVMRWRYEWIDAAGKKRHLRGVDIFKIKEAAICEILSYTKA